MGAAGQLGPSRTGIAAVCVAMALFAANDAVLKLLSAHIPAAQAMFLRGLLAGLLLLALVLASSARKWLRSALHPAILLRAFCDALASVMFVMALMGLPVATVTALVQLVPIAASVAGVLILRDIATRRHIASLALGLTGVLIVTTPFSTDVGIHLLFGIIAIALMVGRDVLTRCTKRGTPSLIVATVAAFAVPVLSIPEVALNGWQPLDTNAILSIGLLGVMAAAGNFLMVVAVRYSSLPAIAPFRYTATPFAMLAGLLLLNEQPDASMVAGAGIIAASGLFALPRRAPQPPANR